MGLVLGWVLLLLCSAIWALECWVLLWGALWLSTRWSGWPPLLLGWPAWLILAGCVVGAVVFSAWQLPRRMGQQKGLRPMDISSPKEQEVHAYLETLCHRLGLVTPELWVATQDHRPQFLSLAWGQTSCIVVTAGLLEQGAPVEWRAGLARELYHPFQGDVSIQTRLLALLGVMGLDVLGSLAASPRPVSWCRRLPRILAVAPLAVMAWGLRRQVANGDQFAAEQVGLEPVFALLERVGAPGAGALEDPAGILRTTGPETGLLACHPSRSRRRTALLRRQAALHAEQVGWR